MVPTHAVFAVFLFNGVETVINYGLMLFFSNTELSLKDCVLFHKDYTQSVLFYLPPARIIIAKWLLST